MKYLKVISARKHNLKDVSVSIPKYNFVCITGVSGSGKSSLAIDTIFAEGQRRYVESMSSYARQFIERAESPEVGRIENLSPTVAVSSASGRPSSRSTVGTLTEIDDFLRLLFAKVSDIVCEKCKKIVKRHTNDEIAEEIIKFYSGKKIYVGIELNEYFKEKIDIDILEVSGIRRVLFKNKIFMLKELERISLKGNGILIGIFDFIFVSDENKQRVLNSLNIAKTASEKGIVYVIDSAGNKVVKKYALKTFCPNCKTIFYEPEYDIFSFNSPIGACPKCSGFGRIIEIDEDKVVPNKDLSISQNAVYPFSKGAYRYWQYALNKACRQYGIPADKPYKLLSEEHKKIIWDGKGAYRGIKGFFKKLEKKKYKVQNRVLIAKYRKFVRCPDCLGRRLKKKALNYVIGGKNIFEVQSMQIDELYSYLKKLDFDKQKQAIAGYLYEELISRVEFLLDTGLYYLNLMRLSNTLSGGELRRIYLAQGIGRSLCDMIYILDEPTIGLHQNDIEKLVKAIRKLRNLGNTVIVIEHEKEVIKNSDYIIDLGPKSGANGGNIVFKGKYSQLIKDKNSLTGIFLRKRKNFSVSLEKEKQEYFGEYLEVLGADEHNLRNINVKFPIGGICAVIGVSGAGKSTLVEDVLYKNYLKDIKGEAVDCGSVRRIKGFEKVKEIFYLDQNKIAQTPKGNIATFSGALSKIRNIFAKTDDAKRLKMDAGYFSFNSDKGRCPHCKGIGYELIDMQFLSDIKIKCKFCEGKRYKNEIMNVRYNGKTIVDVLNMTVKEADEFFKSKGIAIGELEWLSRFGLDYIVLNQTLDSLSAGESQRLKLAKIVSKGNKKNKGVLYIFDEPSVGLHPYDIEKIISCIYDLKKSGNTVIIVEHNPELIRIADYIVELGPEGGQKGGMLVFQGDVISFLKSKKSQTAKLLRKYFN